MSSTVHTSKKLSSFLFFIILFLPTGQEEIDSCLFSYTSISCYNLIFSIGLEFASLAWLYPAPVTCPDTVCPLVFVIYLFHFFYNSCLCDFIDQYSKMLLRKGKTTQTPSRFYWSRINTGGCGQWILLLCRITKLNIKTYLLLKDLQVKHLLIKLMKKFESVLSLTSLKLYRKWRNGILFVQESITTQSSLFV